MMLRVAGFYPQTLDDRRRRGQIGIADPQIYKIDTAAESFTFAAIDFGEQIGRQFVDSSGFSNSYRQLRKTSIENRNGFTCFF